MFNSQQSPPPPLIETTDDDCVEITVGHLKGWVSSYHLIDQKLSQINAVWFHEQEQLS